MKLDTTQVKEAARSFGANLVGVTSAERLAGAPPKHRPTDILPTARSVVVCAKPLPFGSIVHATPTGYHNTMTELNARLDQIAYDLAVWLEARGALAVPVPADRPYWDYDPETQRGRGDISHKHAAVAAGLGWLGKNTLLITPEFGNRVQLVSVITDAELEPDEPLPGDPCPVNCTLCMDACPGHAIVAPGVVNQAACRAHMYLRLPRGYTVESCRACRSVCPLARGVKTSGVAQGLEVSAQVLDGQRAPRQGRNLWR